MATRLYFVEGDTERVVGVVLYDDGVAVDLTGATSIEAHLRNRSDGTLTTVTGLTGDANGAVSTTLAGPLVAGVFTLEWEVTTGSQVVTYPGSASNRPLITVRQEAD